MIYLVSNQQELFESEEYTTITLEESLGIIKDWKQYQYDSETTGRDAHVNDILCIQIGNLEGTIQLVIDATTIDITKYKSFLENNYCVGQNLKFDLQFLYNYNIIPRKTYDTMIVEQLLYLGYPSGMITYSLKGIAERRLGIDIDKSTRGEIIWRGLDTQVIKYAAGDVQFLGEIMKLQIKDCKEKQCLVGAKLECDFVPAIAYLEWCGIKLDETKWKEKMKQDSINLDNAKKKLDDWLLDLCYKEDLEVKVCKPDTITIGYTPYCDEEYVEYNRQLNEYEKLGYEIISQKNPSSNMGMYTITLSNYKQIHTLINIRDKFTYINLQGDLFEGFDTSPKTNINWSSSSQVILVAKALGFDTTVQDKKTGEDKDSVLEKHLSAQKGINDEFLKLYFEYQEYAKVVSSFGQGHLDAINPKTGRIHTTYKQLGASSGRMSCGSNQPNTDLAKFKQLIPSRVKYPNIQQLPHDEITRSCFVSEKGNLFVSCDYSAQEGRVQGDIYQDEAILKMYREGIDGHSMYAKIFFKDELKDIDVHDVKKLRPDLRSKAKGPEFALAYGGGYTTIMQQLKCSEEEALQIVKNYEEGFKGTIEFARKGSKFVRENGYILICPITGHRMYWWDHKDWLERQKSYTKEFWEEYRTKHKGTGDYIAKEVSMHFKAASKYDRLARNSPAQGTSSIMTKDAVTAIFNWIVDNGFFGKIKCCALVHDETCWEYPKEISVFSDLVKSYMEKAANKYCKSIEIPAESSVGICWIH